MLSNLKIEFERNSEVYIRVKIHPGASSDKVREQMMDGTVKIDIAAAPEKGKANQALISFLSREFGVSREQVRILGGHSDRIKLIKIR